MLAGSANLGNGVMVCDGCHERWPCEKYRLATDVLEVRKALEGLEHPDVWAALPRIITTMKRSSGETWAVGMVLEKLYDFMRSE